MAHATIFSAPPRQLEAARELSHAAVQWPSRAARANLSSVADDSHSNLGWDEASFSLLSHPLDADQRYQLGFCFESFAMVWCEDGAVTETLPLIESSEAEAQAWCDNRLAGAGLTRTGSATMPYSLEAVDYRDFAGAASLTELETLGAWFSMGQSVLDGLVEAYGDTAVATARVRCWPHHYDLGALFSLEAGDPETARSIGVGLSPGDGNYAEPYFYCTPWPTPAAFHAPPSPMHWHTDGFTSMVCKASLVEESLDLTQLLATAFSTARGSLN